MPIRLLVALTWLLLSVPSLAQLERAEQLLRSARPTEALAALDGLNTSESTILRFQALWQLELYAEAGALMPKVGDVRPSTLSGAHAIRWHLVKATYHGHLRQYQLAERHLREGLQLALTPQQRLEVLDALIKLAVARDDLPAAETYLKQTEPLLPRISDELDLARHLALVAVLSEQQGRPADAMAMLTSVREVYRRLGQPSLAAVVSNRIAWAVLLRGDPAASFEQFHLCLDELGRAGYPDGTWTTMKQLAWLCINQDQQPEEGLRILNEAVSRMPSGRERDRATLQLASVQLAGGRRAGAGQQLETLLSQRNLHPVDRSAALATLSNLQRQQGHPEQALESLRSAIAVREEALGPDAPGELERGRVWTTKGRVERELGRYSEAIGSFHRAASLEENPFFEMVARQGAMVTCLWAYDLPAAQKELEVALERAGELENLRLRGNVYSLLMDGLRQDSHFAHDSLLPTSGGLDSFGPLGRSLLQQMIASPDSLAKYLRLFDAWIARVRAADMAVEEVYLGLTKASFLEAVGRLPEARILCLRMIEDADRLKVQDLRMSSRQALANIEYFAGRPEEAVEPLRQAAEIAWQVSEAEGRRRSYTYATYLREQKRYQEALEAYSKALQGATDKAEARYGRALCYEALGRLEAAKAELDQAETALDGKTRPLSSGLIATTRGRLFQREGKLDEALQSSKRGFQALSKEGIPPQLTALATEEYAQALVLNGFDEQAVSVVRPILDRLLATPGQDADHLRPLFELLVSTALREGQHQEALRYLELSRSSELLATIDLSRLDPDDPAVHSLLTDLQELRGRLVALQAATPRSEDDRQALTRVLASTRSEFFARLDQLKRQQPDFEALVQLSGADLSAIQSRLSSDDTLLEFYPAEDKLYVFVVGKASFRIEEVSINRSDLTARIQDYVALVRDPRSDLKAVSDTSQVLHDLLLEPVLAEVGAGTRLRLVPAGALWHVPFEALRDRAGRSLDERYEVSYLTSADLLRTLDAAPRTLGRSLLIGAPELEDLPGARAELETLKALLPGSLKLAGNRATAAALRKEAVASDLLHIASHSGMGREAGQAYISLQDGPFELAQVYSLSLSPGALVVLSSCQSALGEKEPGREVTSLASAFKIAGASTVVASHWEVDDEETTRLFTSFYRHLLKGESRAAALRGARLELAAHQPHPYYWASFSLFGSPR